MTIYGAKAFRQIQVAVEGEHGDGTAATERLLGSMTMKANRNLYLPDEDTGSLAKVVRSGVKSIGTEITFDSDANFEQILYFLLAGIVGGITPTGETAKTWAFVPSIVADPEQDSLFIEYGDDVQAHSSAYAMVSNLELRGAVDEPLTLRAELFGLPMEECEFTPGLPLPEIETIMVSNAVLYVNDTWAEIGTTPLELSLISFAWRFNTGLVTEKMADGTLYFSKHLQKKRQVELEMTLRYHTDTYAERANWEIQAKRAVRIAIIGSEIGAGPTTKELDLDLWGIYSDWDTLTERDEGDTVVVKMISTGDPADDYEYGVTVVNDVDSVVEGS